MAIPTSKDAPNHVSTMAQVGSVLIGPRKGMELPQVCPRCGETGTVRTESKLQETPRWVKFTVIFGLVVALILSVLTARRAKVVSWFCADCVRRAQNLRRVSLVLFLASLVFVLVGFAKGLWPLAIVGLFLGVAGIQGVARTPGVLCEHVTDDTVSLKKIHPNVISALLGSVPATVS